MKPNIIQARHIYAHEPEAFERDLNMELVRLGEEGHSIEDVQYAIDPSTEKNRRGGYGALILYSKGGTTKPAG